MAGEIQFEEVHVTQDICNSYVKLSDRTIKVVTKSRSTGWYTWKNFFMHVFLPEGFPHSVSSDYVEYQIWDSLQAFASSITNTLATHAILKGIGVGDAAATPVAATITWLLRDGTGMLGRIGFAYLQGSQLDADCKKWRLFADIINDFAIGLDILSPFFKDWITLAQCISGFSKSLVGIAGGATRAALTQHQARRNNLADVSAKDGSQETLVNLVALIVSLTLIPWILPHSSLVAFFFITLTLFHIYANYRAVKAVRIEVFNLSRYGLVIEEFLTNGQALSVKKANKQENVWPFIQQNHPVIEMGFSISNRISNILRLSTEKDYWVERKYFISATVDQHKLKYAHVAFMSDMHDVFVPLKAAFHVFCLNHAINRGKSCFELLWNLDRDNVDRLMTQVGHFVDDKFPDFLKSAMANDWDFSRVLFSIGDWRIVML